MAGNRRIKIRGPHGGIHVITRVHKREHRLNNHMKNYFVSQLDRLSDTYFCRVHAYTVLDSHFHILLSYDKPEDVDPDQAIYRWNRYHKGRYQKNRTVDEDRRYVVDCLTDVSHFMKKLNTLLTREYNRRTGNEGTLWERRFRSSIVERGKAMMMTAAYIELNRFRASMVKAPEMYKHSSLYRLRKGNVSETVDTEGKARYLHIAGYEGVEAVRRKRRPKYRSRYKKYVKKVYESYLRYIYHEGTRAPRRKLIRGRTESIKITEKMQKRLDAETGQKGESLELHRGVGLCRKILTFTRGKFMGSRGFAQRFYANHVDPGYTEIERRRRHRRRWIHGMAGGIWGVFNGSRSVESEGEEADRNRKELSSKISSHGDQNQNNDPPDTTRKK